MATQPVENVSRVSIGRKYGIEDLGDDAALGDQR
jgi:hypothetical protein